MQPINTLAQQRTWRALIHTLQRRPGVRSVVYLAGAATLLRAVSGIYAPSQEIGTQALHLTVLPFGLAWTYAFVRLREEDFARWRRVALRQGLRHAGIGVGLGAGAFAVVCSAAAARGWARFPSQEATPAAVARTMVSTAPEFLAAAWNEELVFRGYGLDTASAAIGRPAGVAALTTLFAWGHGRTTNPQVLLGTAAAGLALVALCYRSDGLWMPVGYHFAWNYAQTAIFGPVDHAPSLRPVEFIGPELWIGRPGTPELGLLATIINLLIVLVCTKWELRTRASH